MSEIIPRTEYPRPDIERQDWLNLNGEWDFEFDDSNIGEKNRWYNGSNAFNMKIMVPFCYQCNASHINNQEIHENLWYKREFDLPASFLGKRILLNFGAVDYIAKVWVNGELAGVHKGGYTPFRFDITRYARSKGNIIVLKAEDPNECIQSRGKQYWKRMPDRCWYTPSSGIWQTVWLEAVGDIYIDRIKMTPDIDNNTLLVEMYLDKEPVQAELSIKISYRGSEKKAINICINNRISKIPINIENEDYIDEIHYWTPEKPELYDIKFTLRESSQIVDNVKSYFGMRKVSVKGDNILLNNKPYYQKLVLDQGYWQDSLLTPPSDEAIVYDIEMTKKMGFNGARKHQKIEDPRYYYWADRLGLLVWGEMPSGYDFNDELVRNISHELQGFIRRDYNHPCIISWVPINESWGVRKILTDRRQQNFAKGLYYIIKSLDSTRLVSSNDGWEQVNSDICAIHDYEATGSKFCEKYHDREKMVRSSVNGHHFLYAEGVRYKNNPIVLTEYGGIAIKTDKNGEWGYNGAVEDEESFFKRYTDITDAIRKIPYIRGYCYTQLTDVIQEVNGLMTMDRKLKVDLDRIRQVNENC